MEKLQFVVNSGEEHYVLPERCQQIAHREERRARGDEVVHHDDVPFVGDVVRVEHRPDTLLRTTVSAVVVERNMQHVSQSRTEARSEVALCMSSHRRGDQSPAPFVKVIAQRIVDDRSE